MSSRTCRTGSAEPTLGGDGAGRPWRSAVACIVRRVDRLYAADRSHGRRRIEALRALRMTRRSICSIRASRRVRTGGAASCSSTSRRPASAAAPGRSRFSSGCGWFEDDGFRVRQFFLAGPAGERAMLDALADVFADASLLVTFNGRTFDVPFMETRWAFHRPRRTDRRAAALRHAAAGASALAATARRRCRRPTSSCSLSALERAVLGVHRLGDVPGFEIPARYFHFLRTGDAADRAVCSSTTVTISCRSRRSCRTRSGSRGEGPRRAASPSEQLALGRLYERAGDTVAARTSFEMAARSTATPTSAPGAGAARARASARGAVRGGRRRLAAVCSTWRRDRDGAVGARAPRRRGARHSSRAPRAKISSRRGGTPRRSGGQASGRFRRERRSPDRHGSTGSWTRRRRRH